jgi:hypothetical protein
VDGGGERPNVFYALRLLVLLMPCVEDRKGGAVQSEVEEKKTKKKAALSTLTPGLLVCRGGGNPNSERGWLCDERRCRAAGS